MCWFLSYFLTNSVRSQFLGYAYVRAVCLVHRDSQNEDQQKAHVAVVSVCVTHILLSVGRIAS